MRLRSLFALIALAAACLLVACGPSRENLQVSDKELLGGTEVGDFDLKLQEADAAWATRHERASIEKAIAAWESALTLKSATGDEETRRQAVFEVYVKLARAYYLLSDGHIFFDAEDVDDTEDARKAAYNKGVIAAEKALYVYSPEYQEAVVTKGMDREDALKFLDKGANPALYWYATNLGKWALLDGLAEAAGQVGTIFAMISKIETEDAAYFHYAPYRYLGSYHSKIPLLSPNLEKSKEYFEKAIEVAPNYLGTRVLYATYYAYKEDDEDLYRQQLQAVLDAPVDAEPSLVSENMIEKKKAQRLLDRIDDDF